jgi:hypothetical protein
MTLTRIYAPAIEQGLLTDKDLKGKYGENWKEVISHFTTERIEEGKWFNQFMNKSK